ncbi:hypothetical protein MPTK1_2g20710 [Marchantia polymorpha subsp. ruderalis]|uniref:Uncharacterized protein n=1 Tax=Marchantia polymorpha TaxID=3197 RepID=A0A2R6X2Z5_MARPO|nr:hypothetical protein MARPO_0040s0141 [Marchantia polymorpha]BBN03097.1 hypothetical protein Mp_2g20710 [Marchantia polymorpha subsp. ruderalis]|eukprot:PTQ40479.1 hypothetical protein MARPO_0040s0141 [Marchantia polymorpha]
MGCRIPPVHAEVVVDHLQLLYVQESSNMSVARWLEHLGQTLRTELHSIHHVHDPHAPNRKVAARCSLLALSPIPIPIHPPPLPFPGHRLEWSSQPTAAAAATEGINLGDLSTPDTLRDSPLVYAPRTSSHSLPPLPPGSIRLAPALISDSQQFDRHFKNRVGSACRLQPFPLLPSGRATDACIGKARGICSRDLSIYLSFLLALFLSMYNLCRKWNQLCCVYGSLGAAV